MAPPVVLMTMTITVTITNSGNFRKPGAVIIDG